MVFVWRNDAPKFSAVWDYDNSDQTSHRNGALLSMINVWTLVGNPMACWYGGSFYLTGLLSDFNVQRCDSGKIGNIVAKILQPHKTEEARQLNLNVFTDVAQFIPWINKVVHGLD